MEWEDGAELVPNEQLPVAPPDYHTLFGNGNGVQPADQPGVHGGHGGQPEVHGVQPGVPPVQPATDSRLPPPPYEEPAPGPGVYPATSGSRPVQILRPAIRLTRIIHIIPRQPVTRQPVTRQPVTRQPARQIQQPVPQTGAAPDGKPPRNYMWFSCLVLFLCNPVCGMLAVGFSSVSSDVAREGKTEEARSYGWKALGMAIWGLFTGLIMWLTIIIFVPGW